MKSNFPFGCVVAFGAMWLAGCQAPERPDQSAGKGSDKPLPSPTETHSGYEPIVINPVPGPVPVADGASAEIEYPQQLTATAMGPQMPPSGAKVYTFVYEHTTNGNDRLLVLTNRVKVNPATATFTGGKSVSMSLIWKDIKPGIFWLVTVTEKNLVPKPFDEGIPTLIQIKRP